MADGRARFLLVCLLLPIIAPPLVAQSLGDADRWAPPYTVSHFGLGFGARPLAMGGAFMAVAKGPTAVSSNPAGLAGLAGAEFSLGASFEGQTIGVPAMGPMDMDWHVRYASSAYEYGLSAVAFDHAAAAARVKAGRQSFVVGLSYHRGLDLRDPYSFTVARYAPDRRGYIPPDTYVQGEFNGTEVYTFDNEISLDVYTASVAFRILKSLDFGCSVNFRKGSARGFENLDAAYAISDGGEVLLSWEGYERTEGPYSFSGGTNVDFGLLWRYRWLSLAATYRTAFSLGASYTIQSDETWTTSYGETYEAHNSNSWEYSIHWPAQLGFGLAVRPGKGWTVSAECRMSELEYGGEDWIVPALSFEARVGAEYLLRFGGIDLPLRAGCFLAESDQNDGGTSPWLSGICFGAGFGLNRITLDAAVLLHSKKGESDFPEILGPFERSAWDVTLTVSYRLGEPKK